MSVTRRRVPRTSGYVLTVTPDVPNSGQDGVLSTLAEAIADANAEAQAAWERRDMVAMHQHQVAFHVFADAHDHITGGNIRAEYSGGAR